MAFPWLTIIMAILSFFVTKASGASTGKAALAAGLAGFGTYYLADPANPDNLFRIGVDGDGSATSTEPITRSSTDAIPSDGETWYGRTIDTAGNVLESWGPTGTAAVIGTTSLALDDDLRKWLLIGLAAVLLLK